MPTQASNITGIEDFKSQLKKLGLKATAQRLAVHRAMMELEHASVDTVSASIAEEGLVKITQSSVYNILSQLADLGVYRQRLSVNNKMYFDICNQRHIHMYDMVNHTFRNLPPDELQDLVLERLRKKKFKGYKVEGVEIQILARPNKRGLK